MKITGYELKLRRRQLGISQTRLGELAGGLSRITIWRIETDKEVMFSHLQKVAKSLGMKIEMEIDEKIKIRY